jgi:hypothetical protein
MTPPPGLADLLVLLHDARGRDSTVRATVVEWRHSERMARAFCRGDAVTYAPTDRPAPETTERVSRLWLAPPDLVREEHDDTFGRVAVSRGERWWRYDTVHGAISNEGEPGVAAAVGDQFDWMLHAARLLGALTFTEVAAGEHAGRPTLRARAVPRSGPLGHDMALSILGAADAEEILFDVDAERGVVLRVECRLGGDPYLVREVREIAFGESLPDETFELRLPEGESARPPESPFVTNVPLERVVALAPFTIWIVPRVPDDWEVGISFAKAMERPPTQPQVFLRYAAANGLQGFMVRQSPAEVAAREEDEFPGSGWRRDVREGRELELRPPLEDWHPAQVRLELDGTRIQLHSDSLGIDTLADAAAGLVRAPEGEPELGF